MGRDVVTGARGGSAGAPERHGRSHRCQGRLPPSCPGYRARAEPLLHRCGGRRGSDSPIHRWRATTSSATRTNWRVCSAVDAGPAPPIRSGRSAGSTTPRGRRRGSERRAHPPRTRLRSAAPSMNRRTALRPPCCTAAGGRRSLVSRVSLRAWARRALRRARWFALPSLDRLAVSRAFSVWGSVCSWIFRATIPRQPLARVARAHASSAVTLIKPRTTIHAGRRQRRAPCATRRPARAAHIHTAAPLVAGRPPSLPVPSRPPMPPPQAHAPARPHAVVMLVEHDGSGGGAKPIRWKRHASSTRAEQQRRNWRTAKSARASRARAGGGAARAAAARVWFRRGGALLIALAGDAGRACRLLAGAGARTPGASAGAASSRSRATSEHRPKSESTGTIMKPRSSESVASATHAAQSATERGLPRGWRAHRAVVHVERRERERAREPASSAADKARDALDVDRVRREHEAREERGAARGRRRARGTRARRARRIARGGRRGHVARPRPVERAREVCPPVREHRHRPEAAVRARRRHRRAPEVVAEQRREAARAPSRRGSSRSPHCHRTPSRRRRLSTYSAHESKLTRNHRPEPPRRGARGCCSRPSRAAPCRLIE